MAPHPVRCRTPAHHARRWISLHIPTICPGIAIWPANQLPTDHMGDLGSSRFGQCARLFGTSLICHRRSGGPTPDDIQGSGSQSRLERALPCSSLAGTASQHATAASRSRVELLLPFQSRGLGISRSNEGFNDHAEAWGWHQHVISLLPPPPGVVETTGALQVLRQSLAADSTMDPDTVGDQRRRSWGISILGVQGLYCAAHNGPLNAVLEHMCPADDGHDKDARGPQLPFPVQPAFSDFKSLGSFFSSAVRPECRTVVLLPLDQALIGLRLSTPRLLWLIRSGRRRTPRFPSASELARERQSASINRPGC